VKVEEINNFDGLKKYLFHFEGGHLRGGMWNVKIPLLLFGLLN